MFSVLDWAIVAAYVAGTTLVGHQLKGRQHTTRDFFLGGRSMPWYAVTASTIATTPEFIIEDVPEGDYLVAAFARVEVPRGYRAPR